MERERERARVLGEDLRRPVALVHVAVDDDRAVDEPLAPQLGERDGDVVEQAVAPGEVVAGVVGAAAEVHRHAVVERVARGGHACPPTERRPRSTSARDQGSPRPRSSRIVMHPSRMRESSP